MTDALTAGGRATGLRDRMDGGYEPPILADPKGGPIPQADPGEDVGSGEPDSPEVEPAE